MELQAITNSLNTLRNEFSGSSRKFAPLYHEQFLSLCDLNEYDPDAVLKAFRVANDSEFNDPWDFWHSGFNSFGRFTGSPEGLDEFQRLASSVCAVLGELGTNRRFEDWTDWLALLYEIGQGHPTPLLSCELDRWETYEVEDEAIFDYDVLGFSESEQVSFPPYPLHQKLKNNLFLSSVEAIDVILDEDNALFIGNEEHCWGLPVTLPKFNSIESTESESDKSPDEKVKGKVLKLVHQGKTWIGRFRAEDKGEIEVGTIPDRTGFAILQLLVENPGVQFSAIDLLQQTGQDVAIEKSQDFGDVFVDEEGVSQIKQRMERLIKDAEDEVNPDQQTRIAEEIADLRKQLDSVKSPTGKLKKFSDPHSRHIGRVRTQITRNRNLLFACKMPKLYQHLKRHIETQDGEFVYNP